MQIDARREQRGCDTTQEAGGDTQAGSKQGNLPVHSGLAQPRLRTALNANATLIIDPAQREGICNAGSLNGRDRPDSPQRLFKERRMFRRVGIARAGKADEDAEHIGAPEARISADYGVCTDCRNEERRYQRGAGARCR